MSLMLEKSEQVFISSLRQQIDGLLVRVEAPPRDLSPTSAISHLLAVLRDMLSTASMSEGWLIITMTSSTIVEFIKKKF